MAIKIYLDKRRPLANGEFPLKLQIAFNKKQAMYSLCVSVNESQWDAVSQVVIKHPRRDMLNLRIRDIVNSAENIRYELTKSGTTYSPKDIKNRLEKIYNETGEEEHCYTLADAYYDKLNSSVKDNTKITYGNAKVFIERYDDSAFSMCIDDIDKQWVRGLRDFMLDNITNNTAILYMSKLKAIFNYAICMGKTENYPFRGIEIKSIETEKRSLDVKALRFLFSCTPNKKITSYFLDMFKLMFMLRGINTIDLYNLKKIHPGDPIVYNRSKTGVLLRVKVEKEMEEILNLHQGVKNLLDLSEKYKKSHTFAQQLTYHLEKLLPDYNITAYWARHSWATIAAELDIPDEVIGMGLGHKPTLKITNIYINRNQKKVDEANRRIIDYILYDKK